MTLPIKAASSEFTKDPFYLIQSNGSDKRYVVSVQSKEKLKTFMADFIHQSEDEVQIRIRDLAEVEHPVEYSGSASKTELLEIMNKHEEVIFHQGKHDFMLRNPDTGDYIAFDEHGLIFIYTDDDYAEILHDLGAEHRPDEPLIYEFDHWHFGLPEGAKKLDALIHDLQLTQE